MTKYTDTAEHEALREGAGALRDMAARLSPSWGEGIAGRMSDLRRYAATLDEMADCYHAGLTDEQRIVLQHAIEEEFPRNAETVEL